MSDIDVLQRRTGRLCCVCVCVWKRTKDGVLIRLLSNQSTNQRRHRLITVKGTLSSQPDKCDTHTPHSLSFSLSFSLDNMVDKTKVEISEAKATELEKKVNTDTLDHRHSFSPIPKVAHPFFFLLLVWVSYNLTFSTHSHFSVIHTLRVSAGRCVICERRWEQTGDFLFLLFDRLSPNPSQQDSLSHTPQLSLCVCVFESNFIYCNFPVSAQNQGIRRCPVSNLWVCVEDDPYQEAVRQVFTFSAPLPCSSLSNLE